MAIGTSFETSGTTAGRAKFERHDKMSKNSKLQNRCGHILLRMFDEQTKTEDGKLLDASMKSAIDRYRAMVLECGTISKISKLSCSSTSLIL